MRQRWDGGLEIARLGLFAMAVVGLLRIAELPAVAADTAPTTKELEGLVRKADFDVAERVAQELLRSRALKRSEIARVYLQLGILSSAKRDATRAEAEFRRALRLDADLRLSPSVGPHVAANLARAKAALASSSPVDPVVVLKATPGSGGLSIETSARRDEDGLVRQITLRIGDAREIRDLGDAPLHFSLPLPPIVIACATASASVLDEFGNELWPDIASVEVCRPPPAAPPSTEEKLVESPAHPAEAPVRQVEVVAAKAVTPKTSGSRPFWVAVAATAVAAVGTTVLGVVALERRDEYHSSFSDGSTFEQQSRLYELASTAQDRATVGTIATGVFAIAALAFYLGARF
jgi:hypothetical protein